MDSSGAAQERTAAQAGWHVSRYIVTAPIPNTKKTALFNTYTRRCGEYTPIELYIMTCSTRCLRPIP